LEWHSQWWLAVKFLVIEMFIWHCLKTMRGLCLGKEAHKRPKLHGMVILFFLFAYLNCCCFVPYCNIFIITLPHPYRKRERRQTWSASWTWHGFKIVVICEWMPCNLYKTYGSSSTCVSHQSQFECNKRCNGSCTSSTRASLATL